MDRHARDARARFRNITLVADVVIHHHSQLERLVHTGIRVRYLQVSKDLNEICGLGIIHLAGLARFSEPATFRLKQTSDGEARVTTNTGLSLMEQWLNGRARCVEALTLENQWLDVTADCDSASIPEQLVKQWSDRNQRTLVDFRIRV